MPKIYFLKSSELGHKIELKQANSLANEAQWIFQNIVNLLPLVKTPTQISYFSSSKQLSTKLNITSKLSSQYL